MPMSVQIECSEMPPRPRRPFLGKPENCIVTVCSSNIQGLEYQPSLIRPLPQEFPVPATDALSIKFRLRANTLCVCLIHKSAKQSVAQLQSGDHGIDLRLRQSGSVV